MEDTDKRNNTSTTEQLSICRSKVQVKSTTAQ